MTGHANTGVHPSAVGEGAQPQTSSTQSSRHNTIDNEATTTSQPPSSAEGEAYPEQKHAGAVGVGPNFHHGPTTGDKITGVKEQLKGAVTRNTELQQQGKDRRTGELQRREREGDADTSAFEDPAKKEHVEESARAATVDAEGTESAHEQRHGGNVERQRNIG